MNGNLFTSHCSGFNQNKLNLCPFSIVHFLLYKTADSCLANSSVVKLLLLFLLRFVTKTKLPFPFLSARPRICSQLHSTVVVRFRIICLTFNISTIAS